MLTAILVSLSLSAQAQVPARDPGRRPPPEATGTGVIRGRVVAADTGGPIRRAQVNLSMTPPPPAGGPAPGTPPPPGSTATTTTRTVVVNGAPATITSSVQMGAVRPRSATTDAQGTFEFKGLPAGTYRVMASPGQYSAGYLAMAYGAKKPNGPGSIDPGTPIELADAQSFDKATIALPRGAVITGRVSDENGEPLARVQVYTVMYLPGSSRGMRYGMGAQTDDLGQFRMFGLTPGEYVVAAEARGNTFVPPNAPPETEDDRTGFLTTFYPGTADEMAAQRVRAKAGSESGGIEIRMVSGRLFHVTGMVIDSQGAGAARSNGTLFKRVPGSAVTSTFGFATDEQGRFQMRNIPPGNYRLTVRQQNQGPRNPDGSPVDPGEFATMPVTIASDMDNILVTLSPGVTITGNVVFESGPPQLPAGMQTFQMRVSAAMADPESGIGAPSPTPALVTPDLTFTLKGLMGEFLIRTGMPNATVKAVLLGGDDITDTPREFRNGDRVTIVMTTRLATLEGNVTDAAGKPTADAALLLFSDDKASWRSNALRTRRLGVDQNGHYRLTGLLPGRYFLIAMPRERMNGVTLGNDPAVFEALSKDATTLVLGEDEQRQVDVKVSGGGY